MLFLQEIIQCQKIKKKYFLNTERNCQPRTLCPIITIIKTKTPKNLTSASSWNELICARISLPSETTRKTKPNLSNSKFWDTKHWETKERHPRETGSKVSPMIISAYYLRHIPGWSIGKWIHADLSRPLTLEDSWVFYVWRGSN